ncbi:MAG: alpha/beta hydrolase family protein [Promethearchaeia archaeon]
MTENIIEEKYDIPVDNNKVRLKGSLYYNSNTKSKAPLVINFPGLLEHRESYFVKFYTEKFVKAGFYVFSYDYRAHGETAKQTGKNWLKQIKNIFSDVGIVIDWIFEKFRDKIKDDKLILFGRSLGGAMILTHGYINEKAKILIPLCTRYDYASFKKKISFPQDVIQHISPKYFIKNTPSNKERIFLAHCKDDPQIPFENFIYIKNHLGLSDENVLTYETGGHSFKNHRDELFDKIYEFLVKHL